MKTLLLAVLTVFSSQAMATAVVDLGTIGPHYAIGEEDLLSVIEHRLTQRMEDGTIDREHKAMQERARSYVARPPGAALPVTQEYSAHTYDPTFVLDHDIVDANGHTLFRAGTVVNPLQHQAFTRVLCFIDGDDERQVEWMTEYCPEDPDVRAILVKGAVTEIAQALDRRLFFDQRGMLVELFQIRSVPTVVRRSGEVLYVEAFPL